ncbi:precorrin-6y C5,15-methyltransferase (decarboxylating) subunit CbiE [Nocardia rhizosphaerae]|uniref:Precorrin-6y C5,15-methyltransferase (Decarboxylating) subunit CbiE n=1 Tax=Nocardia rhizosphaerae TaxID=1691571 RepID=A0ABV8LCH7_9NOCA
MAPDAAVTARPGAPIVVVGIGADGWSGLGQAARTALGECEVVFGSPRQLALLATGAAERVAWPSPLLPALDTLFARYAAHRIGVVASGDPMFFGIGATLARRFGAAALRVFPQPSSASLACARLGWPLAQTPVVSVVARPLPTVLPELADGHRLLVLSEDETTPALLARLLSEHGFGPSRLTVLEQLGGPTENRRTGSAADWSHPPGDPLNVIAVTCVAAAGSRRDTRMPGLADTAFAGDGQLTKAEVRALTVTALAPAPGELLWDVGGGSGSIAIEWCRTHSRCRAVTFERLPERRAQIAVNATSLGVPGITIRGEVRSEFADMELPAPDAIFLGGGLTQDGVFDQCWDRLRPGGRFVANAVTAESEARLLEWARRHGGALRKFQIYRGEPLGGFTAWRPQLPVAQWVAAKPAG